MEGIDRLERAVQYIREHISEELPIQHLALILKVARNEGITAYPCKRLAVYLSKRGRLVLATLERIMKGEGIVPGSPLEQQPSGGI